MEGLLVFSPLPQNVQEGNLTSKLPLKPDPTLCWIIATSHLDEAVGILHQVEVVVSRHHSKACAYGA